ncbi:MAG: hypothetical protein ACPGJK_10625 [Paracoccaceae bacterium]
MKTGALACGPPEYMRATQMIG